METYDDQIRDVRIELMIDRLRGAWQTDGDGLDAQRRAFESVGREFPEPSGVVESRIEVGGVPAIATVPEAGVRNDAPDILYLHGGAFVLGSADIYRQQSARLATAAGCRVFTLDYRLAPEHPCPAGVDDAASAFRAMAATDARPIVIGGDSAGGNLALAAAIRLRDGGDRTPAGMILISPWVDLSCSAHSMETNANPRHLAQRAGLLGSASLYLGSRSAGDPEASPLFGDLAGLPPALIQVGSLETLVDDSRELQRRLTEAGNDSRLRIYSGMVHEWHLLSGLLPADQALREADQAIEEIAGFIREVVRS